MDTIHVFEKAGLGKAPYRFLRCVDLGSTASSCDYCGTGIRYQFWLSGGGRTFKVGSECICKSGDAGLRRIVDEEKKKRTKETTDLRWSFVLEVIDQNEKLFAKLANTVIVTGKWGYEQTALAYINYCDKWAGTSGKQKAARIVEGLMEGV